MTHRLFSLHGNYSREVMRWVKNIKPGERFPEHIMLDSGAFSAWNKGDEVDLEEVIAKYEAFLEAAGSMFKEVWMINLDKIPGRAGRDPTPEEIADALVESDRNFAVLERRFGHRVLPVFHQGESRERLNVIRKQAEYVCLSPRNDLVEKLRYEWSYALHAEHPGIMSHGLAATGAKMMRTVPWFSVDSASWRLQPAYGGAVIDTGGAKFSVVCFSHEGGRQKHWDDHFDTMAPLIQEKIEKKILDYGLTVEEVRTRALARAYLSVAEMNAFIARINHRRLPQQGGLFDV